MRTPVAPELLVHRLNGRIVSGARESWRIDVYGIVEENADRWLQIGLEGASRRSVLLKLDQVADDLDAFAALERWARDSSSVHGNVLQVSGGM